MGEMVFVIFRLGTLFRWFHGQFRPSDCNWNSFQYFTFENKLKPIIKETETRLNAWELLSFSFFQVHFFNTTIKIYHFSPKLTENFLFFIIFSSFLDLSNNAICISFLPFSNFPGQIIVFSSHPCSRIDQCLSRVIFLSFFLAKRCSHNLFASELEIGKYRKSGWKNTTTQIKKNITGF